MQDNIYVSDQNRQGAPPLPTHRPATRREVWTHFTRVFEDTKDKETLVWFCRNAWVEDYVWWWNFREWRKQPDWSEDDPVIKEAIPKIDVFPLSHLEANATKVYNSLHKWKGK